MGSTGIKGDGGLDAMIASLRAIEGMPWAQVAAPAVEAFMREQLAAGQTPEGQPWLAKKDGGRPLAGAAAAYEQRVSGSAIIMRIGGGDKSRYVFHHFGAQGKPIRQQLPAGQLQARLGNAIRAGLVTPFKAATKAGKRGYAYYRARGINPRSVK